MYSDFSSGNSTSSPGDFVLPLFHKEPPTSLSPNNVEFSSIAAYGSGGEQEDGNQNLGLPFHVQQPWEWSNDIITLLSSISYYSDARIPSTSPNHLQNAKLNQNFGNINNFPLATPAPISESGLLGYSNISSGRATLSRNEFMPQLFPEQASASSSSNDIEYNSYPTNRSYGEQENRNNSSSTSYQIQNLPPQMSSTLPQPPNVIARPVKVSPMYPINTSTNMYSNNNSIGTNLDHSYYNVPPASHPPTDMFSNRLHSVSGSMLRDSSTLETASNINTSSSNNINNNNNNRYYSNSFPTSVESPSTPATSFVCSESTKMYPPQLSNAHYTGHNSKDRNVIHSTPPMNQSHLHTVGNNTIGNNTIGNIPMGNNSSDKEGVVGSRNKVQHQPHPMNKFQQKPVMIRGPPTDPYATTKPGHNAATERSQHLHSAEVRGSVSQQQPQLQSQNYKNFGGLSGGISSSVGNKSNINRGRKAQIRPSSAGKCALSYGSAKTDIKERVTAHNAGMTETDGTFSTHHHPVTSKIPATVSMSFKDFYRVFRAKEKESVQSAIEFAEDALLKMEEDAHCRVLLELAELTKKNNDFDKVRVCTINILLKLFILLLILYK